MTSAPEFFYRKKPWSRYKDLILDYYLEPYLAKVASLRRPILVVDCFAGPGRFNDGEVGSPLIIANRLRLLQTQGAEVLAFCVEKDPSLFGSLRQNMEGCGVHVEVRPGDFRQYIGEISRLARNHTVFVYLDPIRPSDLLYADMESVYEQLKRGQSIEVLINFMSTSLLRAVRSLASTIQGEDGCPHEHHSVPHWNAVAGGTYWQEIAFDVGASNVEAVERLAKGYAQKLQDTFNWVISYPVRDKYKSRFPKYHLTFGSRHADAIELMNRAMVKARREFVKDRFVDGCLFPNEPESEVIKPHEVEEVITMTSQVLGPTTWKDLRVRTTVANPCMYTDSEFNSAIKRAIQKGSIKSDCPGTKIEENARVWPPVTK